MDVREAIRKRRSIRSFLNRPIPEGDIGVLMDSLIWAPSAGNLQARRFYFVFDRDLRVRVAALALNQTFIATAPLVVVACADYERIGPYGRRGAELYVIEDVAVAVENLMIQACALGLGSCWVGAFDEGGLSEALKMPDFLRPLAIVPVGCPAQTPGPPQRLDRDELIRVVK